MQVTHPTDRPNFTRVDTADLTVWFSYRTPVAFSNHRGLLVRENEWGPTTGKHLNEIDGGDRQAKAQRVPGYLFVRMLNDAEHGNVEGVEG